MRSSQGSLSILKQPGTGEAIACFVLRYTQYDGKRRHQTNRVMDYLRYPYRLEKQDELKKDRQLTVQNDPMSDGGES